MFMRHELCYCLFFFNDTATSEIYTLSLHDALPISRRGELARRAPDRAGVELAELPDLLRVWSLSVAARHLQDRKSTRLNSSHANISYAVFCLKKKKITPLFCTHINQN